MSLADPQQQLYQEILLEHGNHPQGDRLPEIADAVQESADPLKGDRVKLGIAYDGGRIERIGFEASGSTVMKASCSLLVTSLQGQTRDQALTTVKDFLAMLLDPAQEVSFEHWGELAALSAIRRFPARVQCASMPWRLAEQMLGAAV